MLDSSTLPSADPNSSAEREAQILTSLSEFLAGQLHMSVVALEPRRPLLEFGADSMVFLEMAHMVERQFGVSVEAHQLFEDLTDLASLAVFVANHETASGRAVEEHRVVEAHRPIEAPRLVETPPLHGGPPAGRAGLDEQLQSVLVRQLELMSEQLRLFGAHGGDVVRELGSQLASHSARSAPPVLRPPTSTPPAETPARPSRLSDRQRSHLEQFTGQYNARTTRSKAHARRYRGALVDRRSIAGFTPETKELQYPIVGASARGSRLRDIDGNEYIDLSMGFGVHLFGHDPDFVRRAVVEQLTEGAQIGPQCARAGELAEHIMKITGLERVALANSGTEAVMTALRVARAVTGRSGVVLFRGSYHGHSDGTLALGRRGGGGPSSIPMAPGVPQGAVDDVLVLDYDDPRSLEAIRGAADRLAAVLVEPVQSRRPDVQPRGFLQRLRALTRELDIALVFDEVITGFRVHPRGARGLFDVDADIATYGKLLGGGLPIGVIAGARRYMDSIDGGAWEFGDASRPMAETTFFAGTFAKNPLTVAASLAVLREIDARGPALYEQLEARAARLADGINRLFREQEVPLSMVRCGSIVRIASHGGAERVSYLHEPLELRLLYQHLIHEGVYVWEGRTGFVSAAHSEQDIDEIVAAAARAIAQMRAGGFFVPAEAPRAEASETTRAPLSWVQEGLWLQSQIEDGTGSFNMPGGVRLRGDLRFDALERAIDEVIHRHAALRTRIEVVEGIAEQVITPADEFEFTIDRIDWRDLGGAHEEALSRLLIDEARRPFDLERGPLLRVTLITMARDEWVLLVTMHHLVGDGQSFALFVDEVSAWYGSLCSQGAPPSPRPVVQYADYAIRQREQLEDEAIDRQLSYWKTQLHGAPATLSLPTDRSRHQGEVGRSVTYARTMSPTLLRELKDLAKATSATPHMVLLSAFAALLERHSGQDDIVVGGPVTMRNRAEHRYVLGLLVSTVAFRLRVDRQESFAALIKQARHVTVGAYTHKDVPFDRVVKEVQPERVRNQHPLFQVWFNMEPEATATELKLPGLEAELLDEHVDTPTQLDLSLCAEIRHGALVLKWIYDETQFDPRTIESIAGQFVHFLAQLVAKPEVAMACHSLVVERGAALLPNLAAPLDAPDYTRVTDRIAQQVDRGADRVAVIQGTRHWSYAELWEAAETIADGVARSTRQGDVVGVEGAPSFGLIAAMVGVLLNERVLLPLDPGLPARRRLRMLSEADARSVVRVSGEPRLDRDGERVYAHVAADDGAWTDLRGEAQGGPLGGAAALAGASRGVLGRQPGDAYVFYTSGTTGTPKAVLGTHRGLAHFIDWQRTEFDVGPGDRVAQTAQLSFDAVLRDVFLPLTSGATLVLPEDHELEEPASALTWLEDQRITVLHIVPSVGQHWVARLDDRTRLPDLRKVFFAGEPLQAELVHRWRQLAPSAEVVNFYGPTETTMIKCFYRVPAEVEPGVQPAGVPLPYTQALVLTPERMRCGLGEIGEIVLRTPFCTRGYLNDRASNAQRFIANPHLAGDASDLYCTGDRGRHRADGQLQILGRSDRQIKLRGVRIELAEVESVLGTHPEVSHASVQVVGDEPSSRQLVAFVVTRADVEPGDIKVFLREHLPAAMLPGRLVVLDELPRLPSGKVDAAALFVRAAEPLPSRAPAAPETPTQVLVTRYARELLGVELMGIHDNFFELGGHSLLGAQLVARLRRALGVELSLRVLFDAPTVAGLSEHIDGNPDASDRALALVLQSHDSSSSEQEHRAVSVQ